MIKWVKGEVVINLKYFKAKSKLVLYLGFFLTLHLIRLTSSIYFLTGFKVVLMLWKRDT